MGEKVTEAAAIAHQPGSEETQEYRAGAYRLLAALLRSMPDQAVLDHVAALDKVDRETVYHETDELAVALSMLGKAAGRSSVDTIGDEFHALFIGLGRGELVPYGSWYLTGFLMEKPLGILRDDLAMLGYERHSNISEPEDHIAALCEVMSLMISDSVGLISGEGPEDLEDNEMGQRHFFQTHIGPWGAKFFRDLSGSPTADFYGAVGRFGTVFLEFETRYFSMDV